VDAAFATPSRSTSSRKKGNHATDKNIVKKIGGKEANCGFTPSRSPSKRRAYLPRGKEKLKVVLRRGGSRKLSARM